MGKETEVKYLLRDAEQADEILNHPLVLNQLAGPVRVITMDSVYYDTAEGELSEAKISLRRRRENDDTVFTVKTPLSRDGALSARGEWQACAKSLTDAISLLRRAGAPEELFRVLESRRIVPCARTSFVRKTAPLTLGAELCLDCGLLGVMPFAELELELTHGAVEELLALGEKCAQMFGLTPEPRSKLERAKLYSTEKTE